MSEEFDQYYNERQKQNQEENRKNIKGTVETYQIEKESAPLPFWQQRIVRIVGLIGGFAVIYLLIELLFR